MTTIQLPEQRVPRPHGRCVQRFKAVLYPEPRIRAIGWHVRHSGDEMLTDLGGYMVILKVDVSRPLRRRKGMTPTRITCIVEAFLRDTVFLFGNTRVRPLGWGSSINKHNLLLGSAGAHRTLADRLCAKDGGYVGRLTNTSHYHKVAVEGPRIKTVSDEALGCQDTVIMHPNFRDLHEIPTFFQGTLSAGLFAKGTFRVALDENEHTLLGDADLLVAESTMKGRISKPEDGYLGILAEAKPLTIGGTPLLAINTIEFEGQDPTLVAALVHYATEKFKDAVTDVYVTISRYASQKTEITRLGPKIARALRMWRLGFNPQNIRVLHPTQEVLLQTLAQALRQIVRSFAIIMDGGIGFSWAGADALAKEIGRPVVITNLDIDDCVVVRAPTLLATSMTYAVVIHPKDVGLELPDGAIILSKDIQDAAGGDTDGDLYSLLSWRTFKTEYNTRADAEDLYIAFLKLHQYALDIMNEYEDVPGHVEVTDKIPGYLNPHTVAHQVGHYIGGLYNSRQGAYTDALKGAILVNDPKYMVAFAKDVDQSTKLQKRALSTDDTNGLKKASTFSEGLGDTRADIGRRGGAYTGTNIAQIDGDRPVHHLAEACNGAFLIQRQAMPVVPMNDHVWLQHLGTVIEQHVGGRPRWSLIAGLKLPEAIVEARKVWCAGVPVCMNLKDIDERSEAFDNLGKQVAAVAQEFWESPEYSESMKFKLALKVWCDEIHRPRPNRGAWLTASGALDRVLDQLESWSETSAD